MRLKGLVAVFSLALMCAMPFASAMTKGGLRVLDDVGPTITTPGDQTVQASDGSGAVVNYTVGFDDPDGVQTSGCNPASGTLFSIGPHTVNCDATDTVGNSSSASFNVTVTDPPPPPDTTAPTLSLPGNITAEATGPGGANVGFSVSATDAVDPSPAVSCDHSPGTFPIATTTVSCTATDASNNSSNGSFTITVRDTTAPSISVPGTITVSASGTSAVINYSVSVSDAVDSSPSLNCSPASGSSFGVGTHTVSCSASDDAGNPSGASFNITVRDTTAPTISVPGNISVGASSPGGAVVNFTVTASDAVDSSPTINCSKGSGTTFPIGTTHVSCTATDDSGNTSAPGTFDVTVADNTDPVLTVPGPITAEATSGAGAVVTYSATATDAIDTTPSVSCNPPSGSTFPITTTQVTCTASDDSGNTSAPKTFNVTVRDTTAPSLTVPGPITVGATGTSAVVTYSASASDAVDSTPTVTCTPASGTSFGVGSHQVSCTARDDAGNTSAPKTFTVTVQDLTAPTITVPASMTREATSSGGAIVTFTVTASDANDATPTINCTKGSGTTFPIGTTHVSCTATDDSGNTSPPGTFDVTVQDDTAPSLTVPGPITVAATGPSGAPVTFTVSATDVVDSTPTINCSKSSGSVFPLGTTTVSCTATDDSANTSLAKTFNVTVQDRTPPTVSVPGPITTEATSGSGAAVSFVVTASDTIDPSPTTTCNPASGSTFPIGTTHVSCTAKDDANNTSAAGTFDVIVVDTTAPTLSNVPADITAEANGPAGSQVNYPSPTAVDLGTPIVSVPCTPASGSTFPLGQTTVNCSASDGRGNTGTASFKVSIVDTTPPVLIPPGDTSVYATLDAGINAFEGDASRFVLGSFASDIADPNPKVTADSPQFFTVGTTTVTFTAVDHSGNKTTASAKLTVLPKPAPGTTPPPLPPPRDNRPPGNVRNPTVKAGDGRAIFRWLNPTDADFDHTEITRTTTVGFKSTQATGTVVYQGKGTTYTDRRLQNGVEYRYVIASVDKNGNKSAGVAAVVVPRRALLRTPADGSKLNKLPTLFVWTRDPRATYYNFQLYAGGTLLLKTTTGRAADPKKILSVFPTGTSYKFKSPWKWEGRTYKMTKGVYTWYVFPGYGAREAGNYGRLMGAATFQVTKVPKPPKKPPKKKR